MQVQILEFFQGIATNNLDFTAEILTMLGEQYFYIMIMTFVLWNISRKNAFKIAVTFIFSSFINSLIKISFHTERPFEQCDFISGKRIETATGYSFPSGHTQGTATFFTSSALILKKKWFTVISALLIFVVGISRLYLGVHWPIDVIGGIVFGFLIALVVNSLIDRFISNEKQLRKILLVIELAFVLITIFLFVLDLAYLHGSMKLDDFFKISGLSLGFIPGYFLQSLFAVYNPRMGGKVKKTLRYLIGLFSTGVIMFGLKHIFPDAYLFNYLRYAIVGLWVVLIWPYIGLRFNLFENSKIQKSV